MKGFREFIDLDQPGSSSRLTKPEIATLRKKGDLGRLNRREIEKLRKDSDTADKKHDEEIGRILKKSDQYDLLMGAWLYRMNKDLSKLKKKVAKLEKGEEEDQESKEDTDG